MGLRLSDKIELPKRNLKLLAHCTGCPYDFFIPVDMLDHKSLRPVSDDAADFERVHAQFAVTITFWAAVAGWFVVVHFSIPLWFGCPKSQ